MATTVITTMYRLVRTSGDSHVREQKPAPAPAWRRSTLRLDSAIEIALLEAGRSDPSAPTIVFVHGLGHWTQACWDRVAAELEATHRLVAFDLPGFGRSSKPDTRYDIRFFSAALTAVVKATGARNFALVGHSLGGMIAADYASTHDSEVKMLVLIDPAGFMRSPKLLLRIVGSKPVSKLFMLRPSRRFVRGQLERSVYDKRSLSEEMIAEAFVLAEDPSMRRAFARVYADALTAFLDLPGLHARFARFKGPTVLFWGRNDRFIPIRALAGARKVYPQADVTVIDRCGHCPNIEYPALVAERLATFGTQRPNVARL